MSEDNKEIKREARKILTLSKEDYFKQFSTKHDADIAQRYGDLVARGATKAATLAENKACEDVAIDLAGDERWHCHEACVEVAAAIKARREDSNE